MNKSNIRFERILPTLICKSQIVELRREAYLWKFGQNIGSATFNWTELDGLSVHFGAFHGDDLISTIRLSKFVSELQFQRILMYPIMDPFSHIPSWACTKAATALGFKGLSLNMKLRLEVLRYLHSNTDFSNNDTYLYGTAKLSSLRLKYLKELGYEFAAGKIDWSDYLQASKSSVAVFRLHSSKCEAAISRLQQDLGACPSSS